VKELGVLIVPAVFGAGVYQISRFIDLFFIRGLPDGRLTYLAMADRLNQLPLGIIGIALGTAILPALSRFIAKDRGRGGGAPAGQRDRTGHAADPALRGRAVHHRQRLS
jgi:peptidoglycan biosynthesis protein MviN/MurJ (putative lipid II flippase)